MLVNGENKQLELTGEASSCAEHCETKCEAYNTPWGESDGCFEKALSDLLDTLGETEMAVLKLRFGFSGDGQATCSEISDRLALDPQEVRRVLGKVIRKLRHPSRRKMILSMKSDSLSYRALIDAVFGEEI